MKKFFQEFKAFISRGNVMDLAVRRDHRFRFYRRGFRFDGLDHQTAAHCIGWSGDQGKISLLGDNYLDYGCVFVRCGEFPDYGADHLLYGQGAE